MIERATEPMMCPAARVSSSLGRLATPPGFCRGILKPDNWENWELEDLCVEDFWEPEPRELAWEKIREARSYSLELRSFEGLLCLSTSRGSLPGSSSAESFSFEREIKTSFLEMKEGSWTANPWTWIVQSSGSGATQTLSFLMARKASTLLL